MDFATQFVNGLTSVVSTVNTWMWDAILLVLLCGTGIWFTIRLKLV